MSTDTIDSRYFWTNSNSTWKNRNKTLFTQYWQHVRYSRLYNTHMHMYTTNCILYKGEFYFAGHTRLIKDTQFVQQFGDVLSILGLFRLTLIMSMSYCSPDTECRFVKRTRCCLLWYVLTICLFDLITVDGTDNYILFKFMYILQVHLMWYLMHWNINNNKTMHFYFARYIIINYIHILVIVWLKLPAPIYSK